MRRLIRWILRAVGLCKPVMPHPNGRYYDIPGVDFDLSDHGGWR